MTKVHQDRPVLPTQQDEVAAAGSELIGGPLGRHARTGGHWLGPARVVVLIVLGMFALGMVQKLPCYDWAWFRGAGSQYTHACYSDIPHLYSARGFAEGLVPYIDRFPDSAQDPKYGDMEYLEYPVLTGAFMQVASWLTPSDGSIQHREQMYWMVNAGMLMVCAVIIALCVTRTHRHRPWDALLFALAPAFALNATINWDLPAVALAAVAMLMWSRSRPLLAGVFIGLATAAKLYPALLLGVLFVLCWRAGKWRAFGAAAAGAAVTWFVVNGPVMYYAWDGWKRFYVFSQDRPIDFGSVWLLISQRTGNPLEGANAYATGLTLLLCLAIGLLTLTAPRRPRFAQLAFLVVAAFILANKVYSPQYVLWLIPLAALARPRWRDFLIWQAGEVLYFLGIWFYLAYTTSGDKHQGLPVEGYQLAITAHLLATLYLCAVVVRDILLPERDVVRRDGSDDPSGGVLDGAEDAFVLTHTPKAPQYAAPSEGQRVDWGAGPRH